MLFSDKCNCECHNPDMTVMHIMACCNQCSRCLEHIRFEVYESHVKTCLADPSSALRGFLKQVIKPIVD